MLEDIKEAIINRLLELYPGYTVYDEDMPAQYQKPSFLIHVKSQNYTNLLQGKFKAQINFDISYNSNDSEAIKGDCVSIGQALLIGFDVISNCRIKNKKAETIENVLHFTFDIQYSVRKEEAFTKMQKQEINTNI
ncbi:MAG: DUF6838 family protein [Anaerocolumna sp.]